MSQHGHGLLRLQSFRISLYMVNRNDRRGGCRKQKLLKTCGVASIVPTAMMKKGFAESPIKKRL
jgi:hypothetical protein